MIDLETIKSLFNGKRELTPEYLYEELKEIDTVRNNIKSLNKQKEDEKIRYKQIIEKIDESIKAMQNRCNHSSKTYYSDPSGNNDSYYACNICGKEI